jgi:hypothetical protein
MIAFTHIPAIPGVYAIVHQPSGQRYIGSSVDMRRRVAQHTGSLRYGNHPNSAATSPAAPHPQSMAIEAYLSDCTARAHAGATWAAAWPVCVVIICL